LPTAVGFAVDVSSELQPGIANATVPNPRPNKESAVESFMGDASSKE
jgi:hypothetical protein